MKTRTGLVVPLAFVWTLPASAQMAGGSGEYGHQDWGWGHMVFGSLMMAVFWGLLIAVVVFGVRWVIGSSSRSGKPSQPNKSPLDMLKERLARGEIDRDEFEERKRLLSD